MKVDDLAMFGMLMDIQKSDTTNDTYKIRWTKETGYHCECPSRKKLCKHIKRLEFKCAAEKAIMELDSIDIHKLNQRRALIKIMLNVAKRNWEGKI